MPTMQKEGQTEAFLTWMDILRSLIYGKDVGVNDQKDFYEYKKIMYKYLIDKIMKENTFAICESNFIIGMKKEWRFV